MTYRVGHIRNKFYTIIVVDDSVVFKSTLLPTWEAADAFGKQYVTSHSEKPGMTKAQIAQKITDLESANAQLKEQNTKLINTVKLAYEQYMQMMQALKRSEQTLRDFGKKQSELDGIIISMNEASNIRAAIAESEGK